MLEKLGEHHKLVYQIIRKNLGITSHDLLSKYSIGMNAEK